MVRVPRTQNVEIDEKDVVARINRYSQLRSVGRAVRPSIRRRMVLAGAGRRQGLLLRLKRLLDSIQLASASGRSLGLHVQDIESADAELDALAGQLASSIRATTLASFRATLPGVVSAHRGDAVALLDFWLEVMNWEHESVHLVEYLITLLATEDVDGHSTLVRDPAAVSAGVAWACARQAEVRDGAEAELVRESATLLRETSMGLVTTEDLEETIIAMRAVKARARVGFFDRDLLRSMVQYNTTVKNRFATLEGSVPERRGRVERTLAALRALDLPEPMVVALS